MTRDPAKQTRRAINVSEATYARLLKVAESTGRPMSQVLTELIEQGTKAGTA